MKNKIKLFGLMAMAYLFASGPVSATVDVDHLNKAKASITARHYHHGYVQFKKMANHGCPVSQCILGVMHQNGMGVERSTTQALYWFQKSAEQGFADAERRIGLMYYRGDGVVQNLNTAKQWLTRAADHGADEAKELLAQMPPIPGESTIASNLAQAPQNITSTVTNIRQSWQGYTDVTKQLERVSSLASSN